jgi:hypothetical protein
MKEPIIETSTCDVMLEEIVINGSTPMEPLRTVSPPISAEKKEFLDAIEQFQRKYTGRSLTWGEIFDVLVSLGYRKVEPPCAPPPLNGHPQDSTRPEGADGAEDEKPS